LNLYQRVWDGTRYAVWHRRILAVKDSETVRIVDGRLMLTKVCNEGRRLGAISRAWARACRKVEAQ
jgi:hypothetical protein